MMMMLRKVMIFLDIYLEDNGYAMYQSKKNAKIR
jgi:hypothetical protein